MSENPSLTKVLHFAIGKSMAHLGKFAVKRTTKSTLANYGKLSRAKHRGKKRSPTNNKKMANNGIFTFPGVKASHGSLRFFSSLMNKRKMTHLPLFAKNWKNRSKPRLDSPLPFSEKAAKMLFFCQRPFLGGQFFLVLKALGIDSQLSSSCLTGLLSTCPCCSPFPHTLS